MSEPHTTEGLYATVSRQAHEITTLRAALAAERAKGRELAEALAEALDADDYAALNGHGSLADEWKARIRAELLAAYDAQKETE